MLQNNHFLSIGIPTYNRATFLQELLQCLMPQVKEAGEKVKVYISNNASTDATEQVVRDFSNQYPDLIIYHKNSQNIGHDKNILKIMEMSQGDFLWLLGDDDLVVEGGVKKVMDVILKSKNPQIGFMMLAHKSFFVDAAGQETVFTNTVQEDKPNVFPLDLTELLGIRSNNSFISTLLFDNRLLKKVIKEETVAVTKATDNYYIHTFLYQLMLLKYPAVRALKCNEVIIKEEAHSYKFYLEDRFKVYYIVRKKLNSLLLETGYAKGDYKNVLIWQQKTLTRSIVSQMIALKAFGNLNYLSFWGCLKLFFKEATFTQALLFSIIFLIFHIIPGFALKGLYETFIRVKYKKKWQKVWLHITVSNSLMARGQRRLVY